MNYTPNADELRDSIDTKLSRYFGTTPKDASKDQIYKATVMTVKDILISKRGELKEEINSRQVKRVYYMSIEFLLGRSLKNNLYNLGLYQAFVDCLNSFGRTADEILECESDAGLGNGGLGRLAACFHQPNNMK